MTQYSGNSLHLVCVDSTWATGLPELGSIEDIALPRDIIILDTA
jgi:hypothetical protein